MRKAKIFHFTIPVESKMDLFNSTSSTFVSRLGHMRKVCCVEMLSAWHGNQIVFLLLINQAKHNHGRLCSFQEWHSYQPRHFSLISMVRDTPTQNIMKEDSGICGGRGELTKIAPSFTGGILCRIQPPTYHPFMVSYSDFCSCISLRIPQPNERHHDDDFQGFTLERLLYK